MTATAHRARRESRHPSLWTRTPSSNEDWFDEAQLAEMRAYYRPLRAMRLAASVISLGVLVLFVVSDGGPWVTRTTGWGAWPLEVVAVVAVTMLLGLVTLPIDAYVTLVYDKSHGLSNTTSRQFAVDQVKDYLINLVITSAMLVAVYWAIRTFESWWFMAWILFMALAAFANFVAPVWIMPRFNKFTPLEDGPLRRRIEEVADMAETQIEGVYTMDASKRSRRGNAFVAGFGPTKRVVLFDTILDMPVESIAQVVAHEIGHYRLKHVVKFFPVLGVLVFAALVFVDAVAGSDTVLSWAGVDSGELGDPAAVPLFLLAFGVAFAGLGLGQAYFSRRNEREADLEALELLDDPSEFAAMWPRFVTLNKAELEKSWWSRLNASHPETAERMEFARRWAEMNEVPFRAPAKTKLDDPFAAVRAGGEAPAAPAT